MPSDLVSASSVTEREETPLKNPSTIIILSPISHSLSTKGPSTTLEDLFSLDLNSPLISTELPPDMSNSQLGTVVPPETTTQPVLSLAGLSKQNFDRDLHLGKNSESTFLLLVKSF